MSKRHWVLPFVFLGALVSDVDGVVHRELSDLSAISTALMSDFVNSPGVEAVAITMAIGDEALFAKGAGPGERGQSSPATENTRFDARAMAHTFLATAILQLEDGEKLSLGDSVAGHLPELVTQNCTVRVHHLLAHTSGLPDYSDIAPARLLGAGQPSYARLTDYIRDVPAATAPGECVQVSATDTLLLAALIEKLTGTPADEVLQTSIFAKLAMKDTTYDLGPAIREASVRADGDNLKLELPAFLPRGLVSSASDLLRFQRGLVNLELIDADHLNRMNDPARLTDGTLTGSGLGVTLVRLCESPGWTLGERSEGGALRVSYYPEFDLSVAIMARGNHVSVDSLARDLARLVIDEPESGPLDLALTDQGMQPYLGSYQIGCSTVVIRADVGRILLDQIGEDPLMLAYQGEHRFLGRDDGGVQLTFEVVDDVAIAFLLERHGTEARAIRFEEDQ